MEQLKFKDIIDLYFKLCEKYGSKVVLEMPVYLGDDDELNGIHCAWYCEEVSNDKDDETSQTTIEMINERAGNIPFKGKAILIS